MSDEETRMEFPSPRVRRILNPNLYEEAADAHSPVQRRRAHGACFITPTQPVRTTGARASPPDAPVRVLSRLRRSLEARNNGMDAKESPASYASSAHGSPIPSRVRRFFESEASSTSTSDDDALSAGSPVDEIERAFADSYDNVRDALQQIHAAFTSLESYSEPDQGLCVGTTVMPLVEVLRGLLESYTEFCERDKMLAMARDAALRKRARTNYTERKDASENEESPSETEEESSAYETSDDEDV